MNLRKVVIVDDEIWAIESLKNSIDWGSVGYEIVKEFTSAEKALLYLKENPVDVALVDLKMPGIDGITLINELRSTNNDIVFIIVSGLMDFENARSAVRLGVDEFFVKPVNSQALADTLVKIRNKLDLRRYVNLPDIYDFLNDTAKSKVADEQILAKEYLGLSKKYSYCFGFMFDENYKSEDVSRYTQMFCASGQIKHFGIYGKYLLALIFTDVYIDYHKAIETVTIEFANETVGISGIHDSITNLNMVVEECAIAL